MSLYDELKRRNVIRVAIGYLAGAWLLIQILETLLPIFGLPETSARIVVIVIAIGFVPAVVFAWVFELTPDGVKRDEHIDRATSSGAQATRNFDRVIPTLLILAVSYFAIDKFVLDPARDAQRIEAATQRGRSDAIAESYGDRSIAVLPFVDLSANGDQQYFSDGFAEEILNLLSRTEELRVISRSSSFSFRGDDIHIPNVAERLDVSHVLEGSVRVVGNRVRITAQLIDARTDTQLWSDNYDGTLDDVFAIQDEVSKKVVEQLKFQLLGSRLARDTTDPDTYNLYLQANHIWKNRLDQSYPQAVILLLEALENDPKYVPAWNILGAIYIRQMNRRQVDRDRYESLVRDVVAKAQAINPDHPFTLRFRAWIAFAWDDDQTKGANLLQRSLDVDPLNPDALRIAASFALQLGRPETAIEFGEYSVANDPLCLACYENLLRAYLIANRPGEIVKTVRVMRALDMNSNLVKQVIGHALLLLGEPAAALAEYVSIDSLFPGPVQRAHGSAMAYHDLGRTAESASAIADIWSIGIDGRRMAMVYAWIGEPDLAFEQLQRMEKGNHGFSTPFLEGLHDDPRWSAFIDEYAAPVIGPEVVDLPRIGK